MDQLGIHVIGFYMNITEVARSYRGASLEKDMSNHGGFACIYDREAAKDYHLVGMKRHGIR